MGDSHTQRARLEPMSRRHSMSTLIDEKYTEYTNQYNILDHMHRMLFMDWKLERDAPSFEADFQARLREYRTNFENKRRQFMDGFLFKKYADSSGIDQIQEISGRSMTTDEIKEMESQKQYQKQFGITQSVLKRMSDVKFIPQIDRFLKVYTNRRQVCLVLTALKGTYEVSLDLKASQSNLAYIYDEFTHRLDEAIKEEERLFTTRKYNLQLGLFTSVSSKYGGVFLL